MSGVKRDRARELRKEMTPEEAILWDRIRHHYLNGLHIRRQHVLRGFIVDFYCHSAHLIIELDGAIHEHQREADAERDTILAASGYRIVRITNDEIHADMDSVLKRIEALCAGSWRLLRLRVCAGVGGSCRHR
jgi:very-short-patch-repair endonuclease